MRHSSCILSRIAIVGFLVASHMLRAEEVAVVSAKNTVNTLTKSQLADIFLGRSNRFPDGAHAVPIDQAEGTGARDAFYVQLAGKSAAQMKAYWSKIIFTGRGQPPQVVSSSIETKKVVAANL